MNQITNREKVLLNLVAQALFGNKSEFDSVSFAQKNDFETELKEAKVQSIFSIVYSELNKQGITIKDYYFQSLQFLASNIRIEHEHTELHRLLKSNDIPYVVIKGSASAMYYPEPLLRTMGDVDFLVHQKDLEKAGSILENAGFVPVEKNDSDIHIAYHRNTGDVVSIFEMHWKPNGIPGGKVGELTQKYFSDVIETAIPCTIQGSECFVPSPFHHGLIMLLHTAMHLINTGIGLRHLCDWAVFADKFSDDEFKHIFEEKLKAVGMWRFAQILTQLSISYLGMSSKTWCGTSEQEYLENLMSDIFKGGNFGIKDNNRINQAKLITNSRKVSVDGNGMIKQLINNMNRKVEIVMPIVKKNPALLPFGWAYVGGRHLLRIRAGKRPKIGISAMVQGAGERRELYKELRLFQQDAEEYR